MLPQIYAWDCKDVWENVKNNQPIFPFNPLFSPFGPIKSVGNFLKFGESLLPYLS